MRASQRISHASQQASAHAWSGALTTGLGGVRCSAGCGETGSLPNICPFAFPLQAEAYKQRTALPFTPVAVSFTNVEYSVPLPPVSAGWQQGVS